MTQFIYREARLQDDHEYAAWEALWADDGIYWIPANGDGGDPEHEMSIVYDNRSRIALRIRQLLTGRRLSQTPRSRLRRIVSNIEILDRDDGTIRVAANAMVFESHPWRHHLGLAQRIHPAPRGKWTAHGFQKGHPGQQRPAAVFDGFPDLKYRTAREELS